MTEEEAFEQWFESQRRQTFSEVRDYGRFEDHPQWGTGARHDMQKAWMARAKLFPMVHLSSGGKPDEPIYTRRDVEALIAVALATERPSQQHREQR
jgi:hypothetical protein